MSVSYAPPPGISSGALRNLKPDYPEGEESVPTEAHGQRSLITDHVVVLSPSPPELSDLRAMEHSINNLAGIDNRLLVETYGPASFSDLLHPNYSETGNSLLDQYYANAEGPGLSGVNQRPGSMIGLGSSTGINAKLDQLNPRNSLTGIGLRNVYDQFNNQFDSVDEDMDFDDYIK